jgi:arylsulfatase A-like enzyme
MKPPKKDPPDVSRRDVIRGAAASVVVAWVTPLASCNGTSPSSPDGGPAPEGGDAAEAGLAGKNILVIMTDQERYTMNWPAGWAAQNLPALTRLQQNGLTFTNAYTAACECSPSRAVMMTGQFSNTTGVAITFETPLPVSSKVPSLGALLQAQSNYTPLWKGKWHLSNALAGGNAPSAWTAADIPAMQTNYGWTGWNPADAGTAIISSAPQSLATAGGGTADNDGRYVSGPESTALGGAQSVVDFLMNTAPTLGQPFCLFVALVNPHDVCAYPDAFAAAGYVASAFTSLGIAIPANYTDDLSKKPSIQAAYSAQCMSAFSDGHGGFVQSELEGYVNFYAYLHTVVDQQIATILGALDSAGLTNDTIIIRTADHGEAGLSHAMTEKSYTAYEEMTHIPFIVSNPLMFPTPQTTAAFYDHQDLLPTILDLAGVANPNSFGNGVGQSIVPVIGNPAMSVRDHTLFAYDDVFGLSQGAPGSHIRSMRQNDADGQWTYSVYFSPSGGSYEYELYDLATDPGQTNNLLSAPPTSTITQKWQALHTTLTASFTTANQLPSGWPAVPALADGGV